jgi:hypothetical protein
MWYLLRYVFATFKYYDALMNYLNAVAPLPFSPIMSIILRPSWDAVAARWRFQVKPINGETRLFSNWEAAYLYIEELMAMQTPPSSGTGIQGSEADTSYHAQSKSLFSI